MDIGCSLGILYYIGNILSGSMFVLGAVEAVQHSIRAYYARWGYGFSGHVFSHDDQLLSLLIVMSMAGCVHVGTKYVTLFSNLFLCVTLTSVLCMCLGCILFASGVDLGTTSLQPYDRASMENLWPRYEPDPYTGVMPDFFSCLGEFFLENCWFSPVSGGCHVTSNSHISSCLFQHSLALIYPSVTGILAGMSKSGQLKNPAQSIPKGTLYSILSSTAIYLFVCWLFGTTISNRTLKVEKFITASISYPHELIVRGGVIVSCLGLILGCLSTAPNLLAAMSSDKVLPFLSFIRPTVEGEIPIRALWLSALLVALPTLGGNLDHVSPYATIFYLLMYAGLNACTCVSGYIKVSSVVMLVAKKLCKSHSQQIRPLCCGV